VTDTINTNGHKYYKMHVMQHPPENGFYDQYVRVDSIAGNIRLLDTAYSCPWLIREQSLDSLSAQFPDSSMYGCGGFFRVRDTIGYVLGQPRQIKGYYGGSFEQSISRVYSRGIGLINNYVSGPDPGLTQLIDLIGCVINGVAYGDTSLMGIERESNELPGRFLLYQNYPNPFNPSTKIEFKIPFEGKNNNSITKLIIYDVLGREVATLINQQMQPGSYSVDWDASAYASGIYFYKFSINNEQSETRKMVLLR